MTLLEELAVKLVAETQEFELKFQKAQDTLDKMEAKTKNTSNVWATFGKGFVATATVVSAAVLSSIKEAMDAQNVNMLLYNSMKNVGMASRENFDALDAQATALSRLTGVADEDIKNGMRRLIDTTEDYSVALKYSKTMMDLVAATGKDSVTVARMMSMAYDGNGASLSRMGVKLTEGVKGLDALNELQKKYNGTAEATARTTQGGWNQLIEKISAFAERIGYAFMPMTDAVIKYAKDAIDWWSNLLSDKVLANIIVGGQNIIKFFTDFLIPVLIDNFTHFVNRTIESFKMLGDVIVAIFDGRLIKEGLGPTIAKHMKIIGDSIKDQSQIFGELWKNYKDGMLTVDEYLKKMEDVQKAHEKLGSGNVKPLSEFEKEVKKVIASLEDAKTKAFDFESAVKDASSIASASFVSLGEQLIATEGKMGEAWKLIAKQMLGSIIDAFITRISAQMALYTAQLFDPVTAGTAAAGLAVSATQLTGLGALKASVAMMAEGGIVTAPMLAMIGEGRGPEAVIPLEKLTPMIQNATYNNGLRDVNMTVYTQTIDNNTDFNQFGRKMRLSIERDKKRTTGRK